MNGESDAPASPCVGVCRLDPATDSCRGCRRTLDEIAGWTTFGTAEKLAVLARLDSREGGVRKASVTVAGK